MSSKQKLQRKTKTHVTHALPQNLHNHIEKLEKLTYKLEMQLATTSRPTKMANFIIQTCEVVPVDTS